MSVVAFLSLYPTERRALKSVDRRFSTTQSPLLNLLPVSKPMKCGVGIIPYFYL